MKKFFTILTLFFFIGIQAYSQINNEEFRATWVITWESISSSSSTETNKARVRQILDNHVAANMTSVIWQVRQSGTAYYNSSFEPWGYYAGYEDPGYDPLAYVIEEAHKRGLEVHAWFNCFHTNSNYSGTPVALHPEWVCTNSLGNPMTTNYCLSPGIKAVRDYTLDVVMEIVNNYDIDGMHFDYIRWNEYDDDDMKSENLPPDMNEYGDYQSFDGIITPEKLKRLESKSGYRFIYDYEHPYSAGVPEGFSSWDDWRRWTVTEFVKTVHDSIQVVKPWVRLSVAALGKYRWSTWQGYGSVYQDAALWFNEGYIDQLTPMHYHWLTATEFDDMLDDGDVESWVYWLQPGIAAGRLYSVGPGSYRMVPPYDPTNGTYDCWENHASIVKKVRTIPWTDGFQFFSYGSWNKMKYWEEAGNTFFRQKSVIRDLYNVEVPSTPQISLTKNNDLSYSITVTPDASISKDQWFAIFRSEDNTIDPDNDEIINVFFTDQAYTYTDSFPGTQDFNGQYTYAAAMFNRFWNRSNVSNTATSDIIPSSAPELTYCSVAQNDVIAINSTITMKFSKTMDQASLPGAFSIQPAIAVENFKWSSDWQDSSMTVEIIFDGYLQVSTNYTLSISADFTDVNGSPISPINLSFTSEDEDVYGPVVINNYPTQSENKFNIDDVITFEFDEMIDPESISESTVSFTNANQPTSVSIMHNIIENRSVLSIKPYSLIYPDTINTINLTTGITDTLGNPMLNDISIDFTTDIYHYYTQKSLDDYTADNNWWGPSGSGSTVGIVALGSEFSYSTTCYLPTSEVLSSKGRSSYLKYQWDTAASTFLLREHVGDGAVTAISIDTTWIIQVYIFGDGSNNQFRFSLYEKDASGNNTASIAEVSKWITIDWIGWRLVEWDLGDPNSVGSWLSEDKEMDGHHYIMEGFHLTKPENGAWSGKIYFDNLRLVKKTDDPLAPNSPPVLVAIPDTFTYLGQNIKIYPTWEDPDANSVHRISILTDTSAISYKIGGHTSGSKVYLIPDNVFIGDAHIMVIVNDYGLGELSDTASFILTVKSNSAIDEDNILSQFSLDQNYPNPFNPTTTIRFSLDQTGSTQLVIFDILGRRVKTLVNQSLDAGKHSYSFDASNLPSGQYIYQLRSNGRILTKKMMLLK